MVFGFEGILKKNGIKKSEGILSSNTYYCDNLGQSNDETKFYREQ